MGFYLRKSFRAGPIRLNLSKSGLGISAGVKGFRIGTGPRGAYVHAGVGGLYYRQSLGTGHPRATSDSAAENESLVTSSNETFVDTGATFPCNIKKTPYDLTDPLNLREPGGGKGFFILAILFVIIGIAMTRLWPAPIALLFFLGGLICVLRKRAYRRNLATIQQHKEKLVEALDNRKSFDEILEAEAIKIMGGDYRANFYFMALSCMTAVSMIDEEYLPAAKLEEYREKLGISEDLFRHIRIKSFKIIFDQFLEDRFLDKNEESALDRIIDDFRVPHETIEDEVHTIKVMGEMRDAIEAGLAPVKADISLQGSEQCYFAGPARQLKKKILSRHTVAGVVEKEVGFVVENEGNVYLTEKRVLFVAGGASSVDVKKILDVTLVPDTNLVEFIVDGRKTPLLYTLPNAAVFSAKAGKLIAYGNHVIDNSQEVPNTDEIRVGGQDHLPEVAGTNHGT